MSRLLLSLNRLPSALLNVVYHLLDFLRSLDCRLSVARPADTEEELGLNYTTKEHAHERDVEEDAIAEQIFFVLICHLKLQVVLALLLGHQMC